MLDSMDSLHSWSNAGNNWQQNASSLGYPNGFSQAAFSSNSTLGIINQFKVMAANSIRTSTIILAAFNILSAFATAAGIFYDCYTTAKRSNLEGKRRISVFHCVRGPATYPFFLCLGITVQGIIFAVSQSYGLNDIFLRGCSLISQLMWPTIFIVPYIQLVFGLEVTFRALKRRPFPPRSKWTVALCLLVIKALLLATGLVGYFIQPPTFCYASLFWFVARWAEGGFVVLLIIAVVLAICSIIIFVRLTRYSIIEDSERVNASRMVYFLILAVITNALIVPFFISLTFSNPMEDSSNTGLTLSTISTVVANITGITNGGLHLFLRSNTIATISPKHELAEYEREKLKQHTRVKGTNFDDHILQPVVGPGFSSKTESQESLMNEKSDAMERGEALYPMNSPLTSPSNLNPLRSNAVFETLNIPTTLESAQVPTAPLVIGHGRKPSASYTLFPNKNSGNVTSGTLLPPTAYSPDTQPSITVTGFPSEDLDGSLRPPPSIRTSWGRHKRNSSLGSSATVQIGIRISNVADIGPINGKVSTEAERVYTLDRAQLEETASMYRPSPLTTVDSQDVVPLPSPAYSRDLRMKTLPPVPPKPEGEKQDCTLNPTVYSPSSPAKTRTPSPRGVGFNPPRRSNTTPVQGMAAQPSSRGRGNSSSAADDKPNWI